MNIPYSENVLVGISTHCFHAKCLLFRIILLITVNKGFTLCFLGLSFIETSLETILQNYINLCNFLHCMCLSDVIFANLSSVLCLISVRYFFLAFLCYHFSRSCRYTPLLKFRRLKGVCIFMIFFVLSLCILFYKLVMSNYQMKIKKVVDILCKKS